MVEQARKKLVEMLERILALDSAISATRNTKQRRSMQRERDRLGRAFAQDLPKPWLNAEAAPFEHDKWAVKAVLIVAGVPSKSSRAAAQAWMTEHDYVWDGRAPTLIDSIRDSALRSGELPNNRFGMRVEWNVRIVDSHRASNAKLWAAALEIGEHERRKAEAEINDNGTRGLKSAPSVII